MHQQTLNVRRKLISWATPDARKANARGDFTLVFIIHGIAFGV